MLFITCTVPNSWRKSPRRRTQHNM